MTCYEADGEDLLDCKYFKVIEEFEAEPRAVL